MNKLLKVLAVALCAVLLIVGSVAATVAYLSMSTETVEHTFTAGNINIYLNSLEPIDKTMMPGEDIEVNRTVTVKAGSEKCYLFVEINKQNGFDTFLTYTIDEEGEGWKPLEGKNDVYYIVVEANASEDQTFNVFDHFTAKADCTKAQYDEIPAASKPIATLTAYAVQFVSLDNAAAAWEIAKNIPQS